MDIFDDFDKALQKVLAAPKPKRNPKAKTPPNPTRVIARAIRPRAPTRLRNPLDICKVVFYNHYTCRCSSSWIAPISDSIFIKRQLDNMQTRHEYIPIEKLGPHTEPPPDLRIEYNAVHLSFCPYCVGQLPLSDDPFIRRAFHVGESQLQLDLGFYTPGSSNQRHGFDLINGWNYPHKLAAHDPYGQP